MLNKLIMNQLPKEEHGLRSQSTGDIGPEKHNATEKVKKIFTN